MAATTSHQAIGSVRECHGIFGSRDGIKNLSVKMISKGFGVDVRLITRGNCCPKSWKLGVIHASSSHSSVVDPVQIPSKNNSSNSKKKSDETALILIRHGESLWNEKNLFTGCVDVPLTQKGVDEAIEAGKRICNIPVDMIYTSALIRAQMTAMLAMTQHRRKKVPIFMHSESEQAQRWSRIYSEETKKQSIPVIAAWQLNERMYGELQGLNKQETADRFGKEKVHEWRRSYDIPPPNGESLEMCAHRAVAYFKDQT
ncbi:2,3-bisphosphoglycerate-dependent phosphoglycerate mutase 2-like [Elaeis guineensis]|uniref:2,3-bisphosphoglycerate-dependent phosphoglycerate mutase 2-like n=1 Tax=Elaeis guineensis var. tenera TaxID=51953 RepID=UPI003C6D4A90